MTDRSTHALVHGLPRVTDVAISVGTCALAEDQSVWCWGYLGSSVSTPRAWGGLSGVSSISGGIGFRGGQEDVYCAVLNSGQVQCWGSNVYGQLGDGTSSTSFTPVMVRGISGATQVSVGGCHACARISDGTVRCWGDSYGMTPVTVPGLEGVVSVASGGASQFCFTFDCALLVGGTVRCWGANNYAELGDGSTVSRSTPAAVVGLDNVVQISTGSMHACAVRSDHTLWCWGRNNNGQLGDGTTIDRPVPTLVTGLYGE